MRVNNYVPSIEVFEANFGSSNTNTNEVSGVSFGESLKMALEEVNNKQVASEDAVNALVSGEDVEIADVMLSSTEAKISLQLAVEVRNKLLSAYNELMNMSL